MTDSDLNDIYVYLLAQPASAAPNTPPRVRFPYNIRPLLFFWRTLFVRNESLTKMKDKSAEWNRGRYLAEAVAHCSECHTPRNALGALQGNLAYAGNPKGPDGQNAPNISQDGEKGIGGWSLSDIDEMLLSGAKPNGDYVAKGMGKVVDGTSQLRDDDRKALAVYIKSLPAKRSRPSRNHP
jgi:mono/diheme cytochrome c family protein